MRDFSCLSWSPELSYLQAGMIAAKVAKRVVLRADGGLSSIVSAGVVEVTYPAEPVTLRLDRVASMDIGDPAQVIEHDMTGVAGMISHDIHFHDGSRAQYAVNAHGKIVAFEAKSIALEISADNHVKLISTPVPSWAAKLHARLDARKTLRLALLAGGMLALGLLLGWFLPAWLAVSNPFALGCLLIIGLALGAAGFAWRIPRSLPVALGVCNAIALPLVWVLFQLRPLAPGLPSPTIHRDAAVLFSLEFVVLAGLILTILHYRRHAPATVHVVHRIDGRYLVEQESSCLLGIRLNGETF
ncbi:hypothetical protein [Cupriavidus basilensis]|nr:hypothetical protein [Cupriavidus basilensis]